MLLSFPFSLSDLELESSAVMVTLLLAMPMRQQKAVEERDLQRRLH
jgi:hypothetical protein